MGKFSERPLVCLLEVPVALAVEALDGLGGLADSLSTAWKGSVVPAIGADSILDGIVEPVFMSCLTGGARAAR